MKKVVLLFLFLGFMQGCSGSGEALLEQAQQFQEMAQDIRLGDTETGVTIEEALNHHGSDGATVVVIEEGVPVFSRGHYGYQDKEAGIETDENTIYQAASLTKFIAALGMVKASERLSGGPTLGRKVSRVATAHPSSLVSLWANVQPTHGLLGLTTLDEISVRRLLNNVGGLNRPTTGTECTKPSQTTGLDDILDPINCDNCLEIVHFPATEWAYSSGGYALAEAMLLAQTGRSAEEFLTTEILNPFGMYQSTFADASEDMDHLARGCDGESCPCVVEYAEAKFPGGLLAHPMEYATFLSYVLNDGQNADGDEIIPLVELHEALTPAKYHNSSNLSCTSDTDCQQIPNLFEICHTGTCILPLETNNQESSGGEAGGWYGLGVHMSPDREVDGYSRILHHSGGQDGVTTFFNIDRALKNGIVIMINGGPKDGRKALRMDIYEAFARHYR